MGLLLQTMASAQLTNTSFEVWENPIENSPGGNRPVGWVRSNGLPASENYNFYHDPATDSQHGDYALRLSVWYTYDKDLARQIAPINYRPTALTGFYTYTDNQVFDPISDGVIDDVAKAIVRLTKTDPATGAVTQIGLGVVPLGAAGTFSPFTCLIDYTSEEIPDRIEVIFDCSVMDKSTDGGNGVTAPPGSPGVASILTIDNVALTSEALATTDLSTQSIRIYPNPASDQIFITDFDGEAQLYDITGKQLGTFQTRSGMVDVRNLSNGTYILSLQNDTVSVRKKFIKR